jgi:hypothetical protein
MVAQLPPVPIFIRNETAILGTSSVDCRFCHRYRTRANAKTLEEVLTPSALWQMLIFSALAIGSSGHHGTDFHLRGWAINLDGRTVLQITDGWPLPKDGTMSVL